VYKWWEEERREDERREDERKREDEQQGDDTGPVVSAQWPIAVVPCFGPSSSNISVQTVSRPDSVSPRAGEGVSVIVVGRACCVAARTFL